MSPPVDRDALWRALRRRAPAEEVARLEQTARQRSRPAVRAAFPSVGRRLGRGALAAPDGTLVGWTVDDAGRALLLGSLEGTEAVAEAQELYRFGSSAERRGVLRALEVIHPSAIGLALVEDALRTNEADLIVAALGPFGMERLDDAAVAQAILKCAFSGIALARLHAPERRASPELARMLAEYALERVVAGRPVPADIWPLVAPFRPLDVLERIAREAESPHPERRAAARAVLREVSSAIGEVP